MNHREAQVPFIEVTGFDQNQEVRRRLSRELTDALASSFSISEEIVTVYYFVLAPTDYAHAGVLAPAGEPRTFIKVHAFPREVALKREAARRMCEAAAGVLGLAPKNVIIYFFDRPAHDVAHAGVLASDASD